jgi:C_GCAxxG_C_C family probable redox protein
MAQLKSMDPKERLDQAKRIHDGYVADLNCAERVFLTLHALIDTDIPPTAVTLLSGMGGGVGGTRESICGAVSGGIAALGLIHGRPNPPVGNREQVYEAPREFVALFQTAFGTTVCRDLVGDLLREGTADADEHRKIRCSQYTLKAVRLCLDTLVRFELSGPGRW